MPYVLVVGSFNQDLVFRCEQLPAAGQTLVGAFSSGPGGKGSNQAIACGRTGVPTHFVAALGRDVFGTAAQELYRGEGIEAHWAWRDEVPTGCAGISVDRAGQNSILVALGANETLRSEDVPDELLAGAGLLVLQLETDLGTVATLLQRARRAGVPTLLNPAPMRPDFTADLLRNVDILVPNESEFAALVRLLPQLKSPDFSEADLARLGEDDLEKLARGLGVPSVVVTLGSRGCFVSTEHDHWLQPAAPGIVPVDTTGAGDAFVGGFAAGFVESDGDYDHAVHFGTCVAGLSVTRPGAAYAMPRREEIHPLFMRLYESPSS